MTRTIFLLAGVLTLAVIGILAGHPAQAASPDLRAAFDTAAIPAIGLGGLVINNHTLQGLTTGFRTIFNNAFGAVETTWPKIAMEVPSTTSENAYPWLGALKGMREWIGDRVVNNLTTHGFSITNRKFENTVGVLRDKIEDDQYSIYNPMVADLGHTAAEYPDELMWEAVLAAWDTACYDGQYFFDSDHPLIAKDGSTTTVSNVQAGAGEPWMLLDMTRPVKPFIFQNRKKPQFVSLTNPNDSNVFMRDEYLYGVDMRCNVGVGLWQLAFGSEAELTADNYAAARAALMSQKGDHGRKLNVRPTLLVVGPNNDGKARKILMAEQIEGTDNIWKGTAHLHVESRLTV